MIMRIWYKCIWFDLVVTMCDVSTLRVRVARRKTQFCEQCYLCYHLSERTLLSHPCQELHLPPVSVLAKPLCVGYPLSLSSFCHGMQLPSCYLFADASYARYYTFMIIILRNNFVLISWQYDALIIQLQ